MKEAQLTIPEQQPLATREPSIASILSAAVQGGITAQNVDVVSRLLAIRKQERDDQAQRDFAAAFVRLQSETAPVKASKPVLNKDGSPRYTYAPYEEIMAVVSPMLVKHEFAVSFDTQTVEDSIVATCTLTHVGGHTRSNSFSARRGSGPPSASAAQGDGAAATYAKRFALCQALNIVVDTDTDARAEGNTGTISKAQAESLRARCLATNSDMVRFLKFAGNVETFDEITLAKYGLVDEFLRRKESTASTAVGDKEHTWEAK